MSAEEEAPPVHPIVRGLACLFGVMLLVAAAGYVRSDPPTETKADAAVTAAVLAALVFLNVLFMVADVPREPKEEG